MVKVGKGGGAKVGAVGVTGALMRQSRSQRHQINQMCCDCRSDTFFIATAHKASLAESEGTLPEGFSVAHINHRGGYPGFVQTDISGKLLWGDYVGNNTFNTLGIREQHNIVKAYPTLITHTHCVTLAS